MKGSAFKNSEFGTLQSKMSIMKIAANLECSPLTDIKLSGYVAHVGFHSLDLNTRREMCSRL